MGTGISDIVFRSMVSFGIQAGSTMVVAFSGGPDSMCLLEVLHDLVSSGKLELKLLAGYVDHMLRPCSGSDAQFSREHAQSLGVDFELRREDVGAFARERGLGIEDAARRVRYRLLEEVARSHGAAAVVTGHNLDDQAETVVMRILRGCGLTGLAGIKASRPISAGSEINLCRPMLQVNRAEILSYLAGRNLAYLTDETNTDTSYLRNRIRAELLPLIKERYSPAVREALARLAQSARSASEILDGEIERAYAASVLENSEYSVSLSLPVLRTAGDYRLYGIVERAFASLGLAGLLSAARFAPVGEAVRERRTSGRFQPGAGASVEFQGDRLLVTREPFPQTPGEWEVSLLVPGVTEVDELNASLVAEVVRRVDFDLAAFRQSKSSLEEALDADRAGTELKVRTVREGDRFQPLGLGGTKKISDFLIDQKVPLRQKAFEAALTSGGEIAWLVGRRLDERFAVGEQTKQVLLLSLVPGEGE